MGASPGCVVADTRIDLPRPRDARTKLDPRILDYRQQFGALLREATPALGTAAGASR
jgi:hypothetical protein